MLFFQQIFTQSNVKKNIFKNVLAFEIMNDYH